MGLRSLCLMSVTLMLCVRLFAQSTLEADTHELERLETVWNQAHEGGDADALDKLWADDMQVAVPKMPVMSKTDVLKFARSGR